MFVVSLAQTNLQFDITKILVQSHVLLEATVFGRFLQDIIKTATIMVVFFVHNKMLSSAI